MDAQVAPRRRARQRHQARLRGQRHRAHALRTVLQTSRGEDEAETNMAVVVPHTVSPHGASIESCVRELAKPRHQSGPLRPQHLHLSLSIVASAREALHAPGGPSESRLSAAILASAPWGWALSRGCAAAPASPARAQWCTAPAPRSAWTGAESLNDTMAFRSAMQSPQAQQTLSGRSLGATGSWPHAPETAWTQLACAACARPLM